MIQQYRRIIKQFAGLLVVVSLLVIFKDVAVSLVDRLIVSIASKVATGSLTVLIFVILFVIAAYLTSGFLFCRKNYVKVPKHTFYLIAIALIFYLFFRFNDHFLFYGVGQVTYVDAAFSTAAILEVLSYFVPVNRITGLKQETNVVGFVSDNPSRTDKLERTD